jgi:superfamily I DNA and/or RNA helicase
MLVDSPWPDVWGRQFQPVTKRHRLAALRIEPLFEFAPIGTVDSFQGQERDIIAITLTRSNPQGEIGFLSDIRRMNVGMTRARRKLLLVGDSSTLCRHPFFVELLAYVKGVGGYRTAQTVVR